VAGVVSGELTLGPGSYALSAKLHVTGQSTDSSITCVLDGDQQPQELDSTKVTVAMGKTEALSLASTVEVTGTPENFVVSCVADAGNSATADKIQLIAIRVDSVSVEVVP